MRSDGASSRPRSRHCARRVTNLARRRVVRRAAVVCARSDPSPPPWRPRGRASRSWLPPPRFLLALGRGSRGRRRRRRERVGGRQERVDGRQAHRGDRDRHGRQRQDEPDAARERVQARAGRTLHHQPRSRGDADAVRRQSRHPRHGGLQKRHEGVQLRTERRHFNRLELSPPGSTRWFRCARNDRRNWTTSS